ncbi:hypothetical protein [Nocardioides sp. zg-DK7169]|uniref:hypothetical protein n=1 Tax=Nocardioides sp. zg-DK7169 TaxID=2736600 RepID=UPI001554BE26|nr:hypothetical protein [Nocardioides sp. zg-DK7169]NPC96612.1 hypothetical protein [Nocardioides sp. zg-DK7169]
MATIPLDSSDAREHREAEAARLEAEAAAQREHAETCRGGWLGEDDEGRPVPCRRCRPWLAHVSCRICSAPYQACHNLTTIRRGPCCDGCNHTPTHGGHVPMITTTEVAR